jgi:thiamine transport system permease protein
VLIGYGLAAVLGAAAVAILALLLASGGDATDAPPYAYVGRVLGFTLWQALLSTVLSLLAAIPMTRALARQARFPGRLLLVRLCALPMVMPTIVGIFGVVAVYGGSGYLALAAQAIGLDWKPRLYGLVAFSLPMSSSTCRSPSACCCRPSPRCRRKAGVLRPSSAWAAATFSASSRFRCLRQQLPGIAIIIFMLCFTTFAVALTLGRRAARDDS